MYCEWRTQYMSNLLRDLGCEIAQGFYIARPMRADLLPEWSRAYSSATAIPDSAEHSHAVSAEG